MGKTGMDAGLALILSRIQTGTTLNAYLDSRNVFLGGVL